MQVGKYVILVIGLYVLGTASLYLLVEYAHLWYIYAQLILTVVGTAISFVFSRKIFTPKTN
jgi:putative flippase GtrA